MKFLRIAFAPEDGSGGGASGASGGTAAAAAAAPAASAAAPAGAPGSAPPSFADSLPADIRAEAVFRDIKDLDGLAKSYYNASKMLGNRDPNGLFTVPPPRGCRGLGQALQPPGPPGGRR